MPRPQQQRPVLGLALLYLLSMTIGCRRTPELWTWPGGRPPLEPVAAAAASSHGPRSASRRIREISLQRSLYLPGGSDWIVTLTEERRVRGPGAPRVTATVRVRTIDSLMRDPLAKRLGCRMRPTPRPWPSNQQNEQWSCRVPARGDARLWRAALARLDSLGVMAPPRDRYADSIAALPPLPPVYPGGRVPVRVLICSHGPPTWYATVRLSGGGDSTSVLRDSQPCYTTDQRRLAYDATVTAVFFSLTPTIDPVRDTRYWR